ncbi:MAG: aspartate kinase [Rickettsiaceae bacterium]|jgi:aspartate kinase|nr:aspartate kinase [Rickettsiaceae bacterium]
MGIIVQKFGGTSVANLTRIRNVANHIKMQLDSGNQVIAVVSAMAGATNYLITQCTELSRLDELNSLQEYDAAVASGEIVTSALLALQLQSMGIRGKSLQGWQVPIETTKSHGNANVVNINSDKLNKLLSQGITPIITGFQGVSIDGDITTLGKGGSDTTAALLAAAVNAQSCDIYTDVDGIYTADPRVVHGARKIDVINIDELYALCSAGAKVLHPRAALAAKRYGFKLRILSSFNNLEGTTTTTGINNMENRQITAITSNKNLLKIEIEHKVQNFAHIFEDFMKEQVSIEQTFSFGKDTSIIIANLVDKNKCEKLLNNLKNNWLLTKYSIEANISSVTIVGYGIKNDSGLVWKIIELLNNNNVNILSTDFSDIKMSLVVNDHDNEKVIKLLHEYCF